jgi:hypothetical protein
MTNPAYLVEGDLEQKFIQTICPGSPVRKINCNGDDVSLAAIGKRVGTLGRLLHKRHSPLVVVFDRERRPDTSEAIEANLGSLLRQEAIQVPVVVGVADRHIENWILADIQTFSASAGLTEKLPPQSFEGKKGKSAIKKALGRKRNYVETIDGVAWLVAARPAVVAQNSPSFRRLAEALSGVKCRWLNQGRLDL